MIKSKEKSIKLYVDTEKKYKYNTKSNKYNRFIETEGKMKKIYNVEIETMKREDLSKLQLQRLQNMVDYCIERVPFYKEKLLEVGITSGKQIETLADISKIPFTNKTDITEECYPNGFLAVPMEEVARVHASSGTTGKPKMGFYTKRDLETWAELTARVWALNGLTKNDIVQISVGYGLFTGGIGFHQGAEKIGCTVIPASTGNTSKQLVMLHDIGATALMATPSYATHLSQLIKESRMKRYDFKINKVMLGAERCTAKMKETIMENLECRVADNYGLTECFGPGVAGECEYNNGLHISEDVFYPEIINPTTGEVLKDGEQGELVFTSLYREAMPLLRYRTGDITSITHEKCACGRTSVRMEAPFSRVDDMFVFKGVNIYPTQIECVLDNIKGITPYYLIKLERNNNNDIATLYVELENSKNIYNEELIKKKQEEIEKKLREVLIVKMNVQLIKENTLERPIGKSKRVEDLRYIDEE